MLVFDKNFYFEISADDLLHCVFMTAVLLLLTHFSCCIVSDQYLLFQSYFRIFEGCRTSGSFKL